MKKRYLHLLASMFFLGTTFSGSLVAILLDIENEILFISTMILTGIISLLLSLYYLRLFFVSKNTEATPSAAIQKITLVFGVVVLLALLIWTWILAGSFFAGGFL